MVRAKKTPIKTTPEDIKAENIQEKKTGKTPASLKPKRKYRMKNGNKALREIKYQQKKVELVIPKLPFQRLVREIASDNQKDLRMRKEALISLQIAAESYLVDLLEQAQDLAIFKKGIQLDLASVKMSAKIMDRLQNTIQSHAH